MIKLSLRYYNGSNLYRAMMGCSEIMVITSYEMFLTYQCMSVADYSYQYNFDSEQWIRLKSRSGMDNLPVDEKCIPIYCDKNSASFLEIFGFYTERTELTESVHKITNPDLNLIKMISQVQRGLL